MTKKKTLVMIAGQIQDGFTFLNKNEPESYQALRSVAWNMANGFTIENPQFDRKRFLNTCGIDVCEKCGHTIPMKQETWTHECQE